MVKPRVAYDIGKHAADEMMLACMRICEPAGADDGTSVAAVMTAFAFTLHRIKLTAQAMDKAMPGFTEKMNRAAEILTTDQGPAFEEFAEAERKRRGL